jgi:hypothetical protein
MKDSNKILREYVQAIVIENDENVIMEFGDGGWGGDYGFGGDWMGPLTNPILGIGPEGGGLLGPFLDVGKTALAGVLDMTNRIWGLLKTTMAAVTSAVIPFWDVEYDKINKTTEARTEKIMGEFKSVYDRTDKALRDDDFRAVMLMINPAGYILSLAAEAALEKSSTKSAELRDKATEKLDGLQGLLDKFIVPAAIAKESKRYFRNENLILERLDKPAIKKAVEQSQVAQELYSAGEEILTARLKDVIQSVNKFEQNNSLEQLQTTLKKDFKLSNIDKLEDEDEGDAQAEILDSAKKDYKKMAAAALEAEAKLIKQLGSNRADKILSLYASVIAKLNK